MTSDVIAVPTTIAAFLAHLQECGIEAEYRGGVVVFSVDPIDGERAGQWVSTAVSESELAAWPAVPPHWVHFPDDVRIEPTNADRNECLPGWQRHSRDLQRWTPSEHPGQAWIAHVRSVLSHAV